MSSRSNLTKLTYPDGYYVDREYDEMNRLSAIKLNGSTTPAAEFSYDALSRRTGLSLSNGAEVSYDYQADNRLTSLTQDFNGTDSVTFDYGYDAIGRLTSQDISDATYSWKPSASSTRTYGTANEVNQFPTVGGQSYGYSDNGMLTSDGVWTYSYDSTNRMESASKSGLSLSFENDPMNRLASYSDGSSTTKQVFSGDALIASYDGSNNLQSRTVFGVSSAEPLLSVASGGAVTTMHQDGLGSVIASTDSGGTVSNSKGFGSFGESSVSSGLSFGFAATPVVTGSDLIGNSLNPSDGVGVGAASSPMGYNESMLQLHSGLWWLMAFKGNGAEEPEIPVIEVDAGLNGGPIREYNSLEDYQGQDNPKDGQAKYKGNGVTEFDWDNPTWLRPGLLEAIQNSSREISPSAVLQNTEYSSDIYFDPSTGRYGFTESQSYPKGGFYDPAINSPRYLQVPEGTDLTGHVHGHTAGDKPGYNYGFGSLNPDGAVTSTSAQILTPNSGLVTDINAFSEGDMANHLKSSIIEAVAGPDRRGQIYNPATGQTVPYSF